VNSRFQLKGKSRRTFDITVTATSLFVKFRILGEGLQGGNLLSPRFRCAPEGSFMVILGKCLSPLIQNPSISYLKLY